MRFWTLMPPRVHVDCLGVDLRTVKLFDLQMVKLVQHYDAHSRAVKALSVHPSRHFMASASTDKKLHTIYGNDLLINHVTESADRRHSDGPRQ